MLQAPMINHGCLKRTGLGTLCLIDACDVIDVLGLGKAVRHDYFTICM